VLVGGACGAAAVDGCGVAAVDGAEREACPRATALPVGAACASIQVPKNKITDNNVSLNIMKTSNVEFLRSLWTRAHALICGDA
jgi:hypothetical protein